MGSGQYGLAVARRQCGHGLAFAHNKKLPTKKDRGSILLMALASLLMRAGERCAVLGESERPRTGKLGLERVSHTMAGSIGADASSLGADFAPHYAKMVAGVRFP